LSLPLPTPDDDHLLDELVNFQEIIRQVKPSPGEMPSVPGIEIAGTSLPLHGHAGGDHILYIAFDKRYDLEARIRAAVAAGRTEVAERLALNRTRAGILLADVAGHRMTDALVAAMLHQAFLVGTYYELDMFGHITTKLFEHLKTRFFESTGLKKYVTMIYGEIDSSGTFRFISAGHPPPLVFSREYGHFVTIAPEQVVTTTPMGMIPSTVDLDGLRHRVDDDLRERYTINEISLMGWGDILLLYSDGLSDHGGHLFFPAEVERLLSDARDLPAAAICARLEEAVRAVGPATDDISFVVVKKV